MTLVFSTLRCGLIRTYTIRRRFIGGFPVAAACETTKPVCHPLRDGDPAL